MKLIIQIGRLSINSYIPKYSEIENLKQCSLKTTRNFLLRFLFPPLISKYRKKTLELLISFSNIFKVYKKIYFCFLFDILFLKTFEIEIENENQIYLSNFLKRQSRNKTNVLFYLFNHLMA